MRLGVGRCKLVVRGTPVQGARSVRTRSATGCFRKEADRRGTLAKGPADQGKGRDSLVS